MSPPDSRSGSTPATGTAGAPAHVPRIQYAMAPFVLLLTLFGSHLATPLYSTWQVRFDLSTTAITLIYACYPIGVSVGLLFGGRIGDQIGRKPMVYAGILLTACASVTYLLATGMGYLVAARLINGAAIGLMSGSALSVIVESHPSGDRAEASRIGAIFTLASPTSGLLVGTLIVHFTVDPALMTELPFMLQLGGLVVAFLLALSLRETLAPGIRRPLRDAEIAPQRIRVPPEIRSGFLLAAVTGSLGWANTGLWLALGPSLAAEALGADNKLFGGLTVVAFLAMAGVVQLFCRGMTHRRAIALGLGLLPPSLLLICATMAWHSAPFLVVGAVAAGTAQGLCWLGCSQLVNVITPSAMRATVLSALFIAGYLGNALPVVFTGVVADFLGLFQAIVILSSAFAVLAVVMFVRNLTYRPEATADAPA